PADLPPLHSFPTRRSSDLKARRPEAAVAGVLIDENTDGAAASQQLNHFAETFAPLKDLEAKSAACLPNVSIDMRIADALVNSRGDRKSTRLNSSHVAISYA